MLALIRDALFALDALRRRTPAALPDWELPRPTASHLARALEVLAFHNRRGARRALCAPRHLAPVVLPDREAPPPPSSSECHLARALEVLAFHNRRGARGLIDAHRAAR